MKICHLKINDDGRLTRLQTELSQNLQQLSERARSTTEFIQRLKGMTDKVHVSIYLERTF